MGMLKIAIGVDRRDRIRRKSALAIVRVDVVGVLSMIRIQVNLDWCVTFAIAPLAPKRGEGLAPDLNSPVQAFVFRANPSPTDPLSPKRREGEERGCVHAISKRRGIRLHAKKSRALRAVKTKRQGEQRDKVFQALAKRNPMK